jgi:hypothetical protein
MKQKLYFLTIITLFNINLFAQPGPYLELEGFEDEFFPPADWEVYDSYWSQTDFRFHSGSNSARIFGEPYIEDWLITPEFNLIVGTNPFLTYWEYVELDQGLTGEHYVMISTDYDGQGDPYSATWTTLRFTIGNINSWNLREIDLNSYKGQSVHIAFYYVGIQEDEGDFGSTWYVDDVLVDDFCAGGFQVPNCAAINSPPDGATLYQNFISFWWNPPFTNVTEQSIRIWKVVNGIDEVFYETVLESNTIGLGPFENPLDNNTTYYWQVIPANCSFTAQNCPIWSFTTNSGEYNYGGGSSSQGGYYFANSTLMASGSPSQPEYNWIDISGTGTDIIGSIGDDETVGPISLGFTFNYFGIDYTEFYINSNGFITFEPTTIFGTTSPVQMPHTGFFDNFIAGYWKNLDPTNPNVSGKHLYYGVNGSDMVITYENYPEKNGNANSWISFQIILKSNDNIKVQFSDMGTSFDTTDGGVGIENSNGTQGITYRYDVNGGPIFNSPLALEFGLNASSLPVELTSFSVSVKNTMVKLDWKTETEVNNYGFEIERKVSTTNTSARPFEKIGFVSGNGNSNSPKDYSFLDNNIASGKYSYRLKQIDNDGKFEYSHEIEIDLGSPLEFSLNQNYPNPFNPSTLISFSVPVAAPVTLKIYDVLGNEVATLLNSEKPAGVYEIEFNATELTSGIYFYQINAGTFTQTKKMLLIK